MSLPIVFPTKNLGAYGEGGAILTNNLNIYNKCVELGIGV